MVVFHVSTFILQLQSEFYTEVFYMKKQTLFLILVIVFAVLTFCGAGYVLYNRGQVNAGFAVILYTKSGVFGIFEDKSAC